MIPVAFWIFDQSTGPVENRVDLIILLLKGLWIVTAITCLASIGYIASLNKLPTIVILCSVFIFVYVSQLSSMVFGYERGECVLDNISVEGGDVSITLSTEGVSSTYIENEEVMDGYKIGEKYMCKHYKWTPEPFVSLITSKFPNERIRHLKHPVNREAFEDLVKKLDFLALGLMFGMTYTLFIQ